MQKQTKAAPPSPQELKAWAKGFTPEIWARICQSQQFLDTVMEDLDKAKLIVKQILS